ncbi:MAG: abhydrolase domain-containing 18 [Dehalococcoidia bacterium]|nr:MAG: abhydrolase domain-containing 18 [Dehalococcoidia bacterium]
MCAMNPFHYSSDGLPARMKLGQTHREWSHYVVRYPTAHPTRYEKNNTVLAEYFRPLNTIGAPLVILFHGIGDQLLIPCKMLARSLVKKGMACFVLYSVFHSRRMPDEVKSRYPSLTPDEWFENYIISVTDVRQAIDWAKSRTEIDTEKVGVIGISFGGFISAITMGIDKRIKAGAFLIAGGNSQKIARFSRKRSMRKGYKVTEAEYNHDQKVYRQYLNEVAEKGYENVTPPSRSFLIDPMTFGPYLQERPVLMLNALWDEYVPKQATLDLWKASGKPALSWFPGTHTTFWFWYPLIRRKISRFLVSTFNTGSNI